MTEASIDLPAILASHGDWLYGKEGGKRANLRGANLRYADLRGANLSYANLSDADLRGANLSYADLSDANLRGANLRGTDLRCANLSYANLRGTDLRGANLRGTDLRGTDLRGADLSYVKQDMIAEILRLPNELESLRDAIAAGRIDGSSYSGDCACLAGTLARAHGETHYEGEDIKAAPNVTFVADSQSPRENFFMAIRKGDTPQTNPAAALALEWTNEAIAIRNMIRATAP